ncbi:urea carboxylase-associated family protein [Phycicoccus sp. M110.8]|uniref:urea carboxylase-associated family protein n=1 Tax=Phycicoccus sp. M110.8 TaxID=3075433 RepID=UPI0028FD095A|nr:urea carboxylase-associated family protein [Phycicoccus sp. M110.8]MDU0314441.1 urea carboxylase-associated family protein [Phycicoccus sp. M110.8]
MSTAFERTGQVPVQALDGPAEGFTRLSPQTGTGFVLSAGQQLTVVDPTGEQVSDLFCFSAQDHAEWFSTGRTIDYANSVAVTTGTVLYSNRSRPMLTVVDDTCGHHDILLTPCSQQTFDLLYPEFDGAYHPSCLENLVSGLEPFGVVADQVSTTLNIFMNVWSERSGELHIDPPTSVAGDRFVVRAEMDLHVGLTACSAEKSNAGTCKPIDYRID